MHLRIHSSSLLPYPTQLLVELLIHPSRTCPHTHTPTLANSALTIDFHQLEEVMVVNLRLVLATLGDSARGTAAIGASEYTCMEALATVLEAGPSAQEWDRLYALSLLGVLIAVVTAAKVHQAAETEPDTMACLNPLIPSIDMLYSAAAD